MTSTYLFTAAIVPTLQEMSLPAHAQPSHSTAEQSLNLLSLKGYMRDRLIIIPGWERQPEWRHIWQDIRVGLWQTSYSHHLYPITIQHRYWCIDPYTSIIFLSTSMSALWKRHAKRPTPSSQKGSVAKNEATSKSFVVPLPGFKASELEHLLKTDMTSKNKGSWIERLDSLISTSMTQGTDTLVKSCELPDLKLALHEAGNYTRKHAMSKYGAALMRSEGSISGTVRVKLADKSMYEDGYCYFYILSLQLTNLDPSISDQEEEWWNGKGWCGGWAC